MPEENHNKTAKNPRGAGRKPKPYREKKIQVWSSLTVAQVSKIEEKGHIVPDYVSNATIQQMHRDGYLQ